ncbi:ECF transporter S component [Pseudoflavonifractor phocaeensis]|uniref:ECF transporter S component n=1 Tax=Pseudoflavonifractor phocaeensis TaxID=1870988 RepID=UPI00195D5F62|nr:ECF transporter S component [Pseudoflavonifractor phocaeensis]MBM6925990.1 ECF transporter S component [Pseudoflavonifractor phocaeensis]
MSQMTSARRRVNTRALTVTAMFSAVAFVLMFLEFSIPVVIPSFVKMDVSELPALLAAFGLGPVYGVVVCLVKNLLHLLVTTTGGAGELGNFLLGACFILPAGLIYHMHKSRKNAIIGALVGAVIMALMSIPLNYYITYPVYSNFMPIDAILGMYQELRPSTNSLLECLMIFNAPFTLAKGLIDAALCFLIYKPLSPIIHGRR